MRLLRTAADWQRVRPAGSHAGLVRMLLSSATVGIRTAEYAHDGDLLPLVVNSVENAVGAAACAIAIIQWWPELLAHPARIIEQWTMMNS